MKGSISSGGSTHIRYQHYHFPRVIQVVCPNCLNPAKLTHCDAPESIAHFIDTDFKNRNWMFFCTNCVKRETKNWTEISALNLLNKMEIRQELIWAWNADHLDYIIELLSGNEIKDHKWSFFKAYINKNWFTKIRKISDINKLKTMREANSFHL
jgi:hypothetical protein